MRLGAWLNKKQSYISHSIAEEKYMATYMNCIEAIWMELVLDGFKVNMTELVIVYYGNTSAINIAKNLVLHARTKHIELKYHFLRERV